MNLARVLFVTSRPLSWVNTAYPFAVAYFVSTGRVDLNLVVGTLFFLIPYNLAMYGINDVFDYESDLLNPRKGGLEGAVVAQRFHRPILWASAIASLPFIFYLVVAGDWASTSVLAISLFALVAYSVKGLRFKERPFLDSLTSSTHFVSPALFGIVFAHGAVNGTQWLVLAAFFLWGVGSHTFGAVQDVLSDREGGISSVATVIGAAWTVRFAVVAYALAGIALALTPGVVIWLPPIAVVYILAIAQWWNVTDDQCADANRGWKRLLALNFVAGAAVTMALMG